MGIIAGHGGGDMNTPLPPKKIMLPMNVNPASRRTEGGRDSCVHHYVARTEGLACVSWICANCDRVVKFEVFEAYRKGE